MEFSIRTILSVLLIVAVVFFQSAQTLVCCVALHSRTQGSQEIQTSGKANSQNSLRWGNTYLHPSAATQHFLAIGTTGSGKSQIQKLLMRDPLRQIRMQSDQRAIVFDAKNDIAAYLHQIGVACQVFSFNPFEARTNSPMAVAWDIAKDITSPARAQNLAASLLPQEKGGNNQYFTDAARQVVIGVIESFIKHNQGDWTFADLVFTCLRRRTNPANSGSRFCWPRNSYWLLRRRPNGLSGFHDDLLKAFLFSTSRSAMATCRTEIECA